MNRRGFTLPLALLTLALMGALACAVMLSARLRWLSGARTIEALQARTLAESEVERMTAAWDPLRAESLAIGGVVALPAAISGQGLVAFDSLLRLGRGLYLVRSTGVRATADGSLLAREGVAGLVRLRAPSLPDSMAVEAAGPVAILAAGLVDGDDHIPAGWSGVCNAPAASATGVLAGLTAPVQPACSSGPCIHGAPPVAVDSTVTTGSLNRFGTVAFGDLVAMADHHVSGTLSGPGPATSAGVCTQSDSLNWGDPLTMAAPCGGYFPVVIAAPATRILGGTGQGLLVATGALELGGDLAFSGVVIAAGPVLIHDQARITGVVLTQDSLTVSGSALIERSRCATTRALLGGARPRPLDRSWFRWD
ncbi:MAG: hypothetical protein ABI655_14150 [Phenylobacterium sp.]